MTDPTVTALGIETSGAEGSVAVVRDGSSLGETVLSPGLVHGRQVIPALRDLLERLRLPLADVSIIAVNRGPGSHTGLRVGVTAAKVLGFAIGRPVRGIEAVDALVDQVRRQSGAAVSEPVAVAIDARSDRVFGGIWDNGDWRSPPALGPAAALAEALPPGTIVVGSGREAVRAACAADTRDAGPEASRVQATTLARIAAAAPGEANDARQLTARYFR